MSIDPAEEELLAVVDDGCDKFFDELYAYCQRNDVPIQLMASAMHRELGSSMSGWFTKHVTRIKRQGPQPKGVGTPTPQPERHTP